MSVCDGDPICLDCPAFDELVNRDLFVCWLDVHSTCEYSELPLDCPHIAALKLAAAGTHILKAFPIGVAGFMEQGEATTYTGGEGNE